jgi:hypothetical protein
MKRIIKFKFGEAKKLKEILDPLVADKLKLGMQKKVLNWALAIAGTSSKRH